MPSADTVKGIFRLCRMKIVRLCAFNEIQPLSRYSASTNQSTSSLVCRTSARTWLTANKNSDEMSESFTAFQAELRSAILASTKLATNLPVPADIGYHRTLSRQYAKQSDVASARLLKLADKLLTLVSNDNEAVLEAQATLPHSKKRKARAELDEDVVADSHSFQSNVVDCVRTIG